MGIYEKILAAKIAFPPHIDSITKDLIRRLLTVDRSKRLGNLRGGAMDVMMHPWFSGVDWGSLERRQIRAPIIPPVAGVGESGDASLDSVRVARTKVADSLSLPSLQVIPKTSKSTHFLVRTTSLDSSPSLQHPTFMDRPSRFVDASPSSSPFPNVVHTHSSPLSSLLQDF